MDILYERSCGLDIHKRTVVACLIVPGPTGQPLKEVRGFGTMTDELLRLADWLMAAGCTHVAMESTGVYWKPIWNLLEDQFILLLVITPGTSRQCPGARPTPRTANGWLTCCATGSCAAASSPTERSASCVS
jgi:hypothetical protein